jgi:hypothetical protein
MSLPRTILACALLGVLAPGVLVAQSIPSTTQPVATEPAAADDARSIAARYRDLAATDPVVRNNARVALMGLSEDRLPMLRDAVRDNLPMTPAQGIVLRDIVIHAFMASKAVDTPDGTEGFLGLMSPSFGEGMLAGQVIMPDPDRPGTTIAGAAFRERTPGFCAYRWLQDGDVIVACGANDLQPVTGFGELRGVIQTIRPGTTIRMRVLRAGRFIDLRFVLSAKPAAANSNNTAQFKYAIDELMEKAQDYWKAEFAPYVDPDFT